MLGREVGVLVDEQKEPGDHSVVFNAAGLASGVYFYRIETRPLGTQTAEGVFTSVKKMMILK